jgi:hypothetical protein
LLAVLLAGSAAGVGAVPPRVAVGVLELGCYLFFELAQFAQDRRMLERVLAFEPPAQSGDGGGGGSCLSLGVGLRAVPVARDAAPGPVAHRARSRVGPTRSGRAGSMASRPPGTLPSASGTVAPGASRNAARQITITARSGGPGRGREMQRTGMAVLRLRWS